MNALTTSMKLRMEEASSAPMYLQLQEQLRDYICKEQLKPGTRLPDVKTLATAAGVGVKTACRALDGLIGEGICCRRPKKGTFIAEAISAIPDTGRRNIVGLFHFRPNINKQVNPIEESVFQGVSKEARRCDADLIFLSGYPEDTLRQYNAAPGLSPRGMLAYSWDYDEILSLAQIFPSMRFVIVNYYQNGFEDTPDNVYGVFNDDFGGSYSATDRFIAEGAENIGYLSLRLQDDNYLLREQGAMAAASDSHIRFTRHEIPYTSRVDQFKAGYTAAEALLTSEPGIDTVLTVNDLLATGFALYLQEHKPNSKIRLCGYDRTPRKLPKVKKFSTIAINFQRMGEKAVDLITGSKPRTKALRLFPQLIIESQ
jgi:DNA-binding LacI/PurR family transcriptional regulator